MGKIIIDTLYKDTEPIDFTYKGEQYEGYATTKPNVKLTFLDKVKATVAIFRGKLLPIYFVSDLSKQEISEFVEDYYSKELK